MIGRRSYLKLSTAFSIIMLPECVEFNGLYNQQSDDENEFQSYEVTRIDSNAEGQLTMTGSIARQPHPDRPGTLQFELRNEGDETRTWWPFHGSAGSGETPFNGQFIEAVDGEKTLYLRDHDPDVGADDGNFERVDGCWVTTPPPDGDPEVTLEPGETHVRSAGIAVDGRDGGAITDDSSRGETSDDESGERCVDDGTYTATQTLSVFEETNEHPTEDDAMDEVTLTLELDVEFSDGDE